MYVKKYKNFLLRAYLQNRNIYAIFVITIQ